MTARGWVYEPNRWQPPEPADKAQDWRYGDDVPLHRKSGYGLAAGARSAPASPDDAYVEGLSPRRRTLYTDALMGTAAHRVDATLPNGEVVFLYTDGCLSRAEQDLYGDLRKWLVASTVVANLPYEVDDLIAKDRRLAATVRPWSTCMTRRGLRYATPQEARGRIAASYEKAAPAARADVRRQETALAVADAECDRLTGRARVVRSLDARCRDRIEEERTPEIRAYRQAVDRALKRLGTAATPRP
ncbi:hypothetical protein ABZ858_29760 [Streptomyces sp. NPDC047017]|uniref:hypothetical protein n=1 Tax=Streptomyces sp. NPDC047017 TaxID=3155024 RepID=UPI0033F3E466